LATAAPAAGGVALAAAATSVAAAVRSRRSAARLAVPDRPARAPSDPPFVAAAVRGIIERQAALPSTRHSVRLRPQAGRQESRQAGQVDVREAQQGENPRGK